MKRRVIGLFSLIVAASAGGCNTSQFGSPTNITLEQALTSVGTGLAGLRAAERAQIGAGGLVPQSVTVSFDVGASASDNGSLTIQASGPASSPVNASASGAASSTISANRSNQVTVTLTNMLFAPSTGIMASTPDTMAKLLDTLKAHGYDLYVMDDTKVPDDAKAQLQTLLKGSNARLNAVFNASAGKANQP